MFATMRNCFKATLSLYTISIRVIILYTHVVASCISVVGSTCAYDTTDPFATDECSHIAGAHCGTTEPRQCVCGDLYHTIGDACLPKGEWFIYYLYNAMCSETSYQGVNTHTVFLFVRPDVVYILL